MPPLKWWSATSTWPGKRVRPPLGQESGFGRTLIAHALELKGELSLEVYTENKQAVRFYASLGFKEMSRRDVDDFGYPYQNASLHLKG